MPNIFTISAAKVLSAGEDLKNNLLFLGYFFFNSFYDTLVVTDIERFGDSDQILDAMGEVVKAGRYYARGYYDYEQGVKDKDKKRLNRVHSITSPNHQLAIVIKKAGVKGLGVYNHINLDIRFMPTAQANKFPDRDYDVYHQEFNEPFRMDKDNSYIVIHGSCHDNEVLGKLKDSFNGCYLPETFSFVSANGECLTTNLSEYFGYLGLIGSNLTNGVLRFSTDRNNKLTRFFMELTAEALKAGIATTGVVEVYDFSFKVNPENLIRFGITFAYDEFGFPDGFHISTEEVFSVEGRNEASTTISRHFNYLQAV